MKKGTHRKMASDRVWDPAPGRRTLAAGPSSLLIKSNCDSPHCRGSAMEVGCSSNSKAREKQR